VETVQVILGSESDLEILKSSDLPKILEGLEVSWECHVISAHRNADDLHDHCQQAVATDSKIFIAAAGMAAALPGAIAAITKGQVPVIGVALESSDGFLSGMDALLSMVRMPPGVPVITAGIGKPGLKNAALIACQILALTSPTFQLTFQKLLAASGKKPRIGIKSEVVSQKGVK